MLGLFIWRMQHVIGCWKSVNKPAVQLFTFINTVFLMLFLMLLVITSTQKETATDKSFIHLLSGKTEANNNIGQVRQMRSITIRSGQFIFLVSAMVFLSALPTIILFISIKYFCSCVIGLSTSHDQIFPR